MSELIALESEMAEGNKRKWMAISLGVAILGLAANFMPYSHNDDSSRKSDTNTKPLPTPVVIPRRLE